MISEITAPAPRPLDDAATLADGLRLARCLAWKFARGEGRIVPADDLTAEAFYALAYANQRFNPALNVPFHKYAIMVICHRLRHLTARRRRIRDNEVPMPKLPHKPDEDWQPADPETGDEAGEAMDTAAMWAAVRKALPARERELVEVFAASAGSLARCGRKLGVSRQRAAQLFKRAKKRLRAGLLAY